MKRLRRGASPRSAGVMVRRQSGRRGVAAVELAVVLPLLVFLLIGVWEVARLIEHKQILLNACREAGRHAATGARTTASVRATLENYLRRANVDITDLEIEIENLTSSVRPDPSKANQLDRFLIRARLPVENFRVLDQNFFVATTHLVAESEWRSMKDIPLNDLSDIPPED